MIDFKQFSLYALFILMGCVFFKCDEKNAIPSKEPNVKSVESGIRFVTKYEIKEGGMKYILFRTDAGMQLVNITKDSLTVKHLKNYVKKND